MRVSCKTLGLVLTLVTAPLSAHAGQELDDQGTLNLMIENDLFGTGTDRHFTHGTKISYTTREYLPDDQGPIAEVARLIPFWPEGARARATYGLGQNIYTPEDISLAVPPATERPYAGWFYVSGGLVAVAPNGWRSDAMVLELGMVGPASLAEQTQETWHDLFSLQDPNGWENQLKNEPGLALTYEHTRKLWQVGLGQHLSMDFVPNAGFALGNVATYLSAGATMRIGKDLTTDLGPPRIRPSLPGSNFVRAAKGFNWYAFASFGGRLVARNIFLDGNTFTDSPSVDKEPLVVDLQTGFAMQYSDWRFTYTYVIRSKEFETQNRIDKFGALSVSYRF